MSLIPLGENTLPDKTNEIAQQQIPPASTLLALESCQGMDCQTRVTHIFWVMEEVSVKTLHESIHYVTHSILALPPGTQLSTAHGPGQQVPDTEIPRFYATVKAHRFHNEQGYLVTHRPCNHIAVHQPNPVIVQETDLQLDPGMPPNSTTVKAGYKVSPTLEVTEENTILSQQQLQTLPLETINFTHQWQPYDLEKMGAFSKVDFLRNIRTNKEVAVKRARIDTLGGYLLSREVYFLLKGQGAHTVQPLGIAFVAINSDAGLIPELWLAMESINGENLHEFIRMHQDSVDDEFTCTVLEQVLRAALWIHRKNIVHRDIKPRNIFLEMHSQEVSSAQTIEIARSARLGDFGLATHHHPDRPLHVVTGSAYYEAPEAARPKTPEECGYNGIKTDIWAIGGLACFCLTQTHPFSEFCEHFQDPEQLRELRRKGNFHELGSDEYLTTKLPAHTNPSAREFIQSCCQEEPENRPDTQELLALPWITRTKSGK